MMTHPTLAVVLLPFASSSGCDNLCGHPVSQTNAQVGGIIGLAAVGLVLIIGLGYGVGYSVIRPVVKKRRAEKSR